MKRYLIFLAFLTSVCFGQTLSRVVPHLPANDQWKSTLTFRNDSNLPTEFIIEFFAADGSPVSLVFFDSLQPNTAQTGSAFIIRLAEFEIYSLDFDSIGTGGLNVASFHAFISTVTSSTTLSMEAIYNLFDGPDMVASVGVPVTAPGQRFFMNVDQRINPYTQRQRFRGSAITNTFDSNCDCLATLYSDLGFIAAETQFQIPPRGKWLGTTYDLFDTIDFLLDPNPSTPNDGTGIGYIEFQCSLPVGVLGLAFENSTPIVASVPIDFFEFSKRKEKAMRRLRPQTGERKSHVTLLKK